MYFLVSKDPLRAYLGGLFFSLGVGREGKGAKLMDARCKDFTPTAGLGCRSGGYLVYFVITVFLLLIELAVWWLTHETTHTSKDILARLGKKLAHHRSLQRQGSAETGEVKSQRAHAVLHWFRSTALRDVIKNYLMRPCEMVNSVWLTYIIFAQTFGSYQTCDCMATVWAGKGGYINFKT